MIHFVNWPKEVSSSLVYPENIMIIIINENIFYNNNYCYIVFSLLVYCYMYTTV